MLRTSGAGKDVNRVRADKVADQRRHPGLAGAVLRPLSGGAYRWYTKEPLVSDLHALLKRWRLRVLELQKTTEGTGLPVVLQSYCLNCKPYGVAARVKEEGRGKPKCCRAARVCPWCWGRRNLRDVLRLVDPHRLAGGRVGLLRYHADLHDPWDTALAVGAGMARQAPKDLRNLLEERGVVGTVTLATLEPTPKGLRVLVSCLFAEPIQTTGCVWPEGARWPATQRKRDLCRLLRTFALYPPGLFDADAGRTAALLAATHGLHTLKTHGVFRAGGGSADE
jgi:hypothetical protein